MHLEDLGVVGNCQFSALVDNRGDVVWCCFPRFDSEPVFSTLLDQTAGGHFSIGPAGGEAGTQRYVPIIAGPSIAGVVLAVWGPAACYSVDACSWLAMLAALILLRAKIPQ